ncbi:uncharacterized protein LOC119382253 [Rhipicephalus sanguineus]|uniref:uncharacterized protein LOC119382253 n=1 Tax=Rhipicephalus sanguineus TaxID=34632 RepID=UPI001893206A|nr:uncharacterized protein LOC119382253 [Rhipicephalus sanguineus]
MRRPIFETYLHIFADASESAYGAVAYASMFDSKGEACSAILFAKTRVAPIKTITLARLELMSALLAARIYRYLSSNSDLHFKKVTIWSDSQITLCWIRKEPTAWKTFVRNRVAEIQKLTDLSFWRFCPGKENPADLLTRGISAEKLHQTELWWHGPKWMTDPSRWPEDSCQDMRGEVPECASTTMTHAVSAKPPLERLIDTERFSSRVKLLRVTAWVLRYTKKLKRVPISSQELLTEELQEAEMYLIRAEQKIHFRDEMTHLSENKPVKSLSQVRHLRLLLDNGGLIRVQGRALSQSENYGAQNLILLPRDSYFTTLIIRQAHTKVLHCGVRDTLIQIRERFWVPQARQLVKKVIRQCLVCQRMQAKPVQQETPSLPSDRCTKAEPFLVTGIDFAGPLYV